MQIEKLDRMVRGWFVGDFEPSVIRTPAFEVGVKFYKAGDKEDWHVHKIAGEVTVIVSGEVRMNGSAFVTGDIIALAPGEGSDFEAITDATTCVVKMPSVLGDKYGRSEA